MTNLFAPQNQPAIPTFVISAENFKNFCNTLDYQNNNWITANAFSGKFGQALLMPRADGSIAFSLLGIGTEKDQKKNRYCLAAAAQRLPYGNYYLANDFYLPNKDIELFGWLMLGYSFDKYKTRVSRAPRLVPPIWADQAKIEAQVKAETLCCNLINTPANDMSPSNLLAASQKLAKEFNAELNVIVGEELIDQNFPMIHAVGRSSISPPHLIELRHGLIGPKLTLVGKGVCFDTGGLNIKSGGSIGLMKKDMGGAANTLALARMIMELGYPCQLQVLVPAVENSISGNALRPQDVLLSRKGLTVEINNTDAEGRLVLADALTYASECNPDLIISMATLTGAARVAVGAEITPFFAGCQAHSDVLMQTSKTTKDPLWQMPFWEPYEDMIESEIADLDNAPKGGFAGSITAALFLRRFVANPRTYIHFDIYGWNPTGKPGRPAGGALQGPRAIFEALDRLLQT